MSTALRPVLRPSAIHPLPTLFTSTSYICQPCRHARLLRRPKRPYTFTQLVTLSDGSAFLQRTCSPLPVHRSTRDTRNTPLWNPSSRELLSIEDDEAGRLAGFRARFGGSFDSKKTVIVADPKPASDVQDVQAKRQDAPISKAKDIGPAGSASIDVTETQGERGEQHVGQKQAPTAQIAQEEDDGWDFGDDDANLLDLISSFGQEEIKVRDDQVVKKSGKK
ncbi:hypothetical protein DV736_g887, partial [Chaetothyriales sp. CBS 134916]